MKRRLLSLFLGAVLVMCMAPTSFAISVIPTPSGDELDISKSKTATDLDENYETEVTLSLPSAEENLATDIVLVMDVSMCASEALPAAQKLLSQINDIQESTGANIKTGIVMYKGNAVPFQELTTMTSEENAEMQELFDSLIVPGNKNATKDAVRAYLKEGKFTDGNGNSYTYMNSGTNLPSGLELAKEMLDGDTSVPNARKYMVLISDGSTYLYTKDGDYTKAYSRTYGGANYKGGLYEANSMKRNSPATPPSLNSNKEALGYTEDAAGWIKWMNYILENNANFEQYDFLVETAGVLPAEYTAIPTGTSDVIFNVWYSDALSGQLYTEMQEDYNCYYAYIEDSENSSGRKMLTALTDEDHVIDVNASAENMFDDIQKEMLYLVDAGSSISDIIGNDFDLKDLDSFRLTVGGEELDKVIDGNTIYFGKTDSGDYRFMVEYTDGDPEQFDWFINETVYNVAPVQLTYTLKLTNPSKTAGTYGAKDLNGDGVIDDTEEALDESKALYTNESAVLFPVDSNGIMYTGLEFGKPSVTYTVKDKSDEGGKDDTDKDTEEPEETEEDTETPDTGDHASLFLWITLAAVAIAAVCAMMIRRRRA